MRDWIKRIIEALQYLRVTDRDKAVFGSWHHGYRLDSPLPHDDIRKLEETYELSLPEDYAAFLQEAGNGGAGPGYGLERFGYVAERRSIPTAKPRGERRLVSASPGVTVFEQDFYDETGKKVDPFTVRYYGLMTILAGDGPVGPRAPSRPFPLSAPFQEMTEEMWTLDEKDWSEEMRAEYRERQRLWRELDFNAGSLLLADYGCGITASVVTNGIFRGQVWLLDPNVNRWIPFGMASNIHYAGEGEPGDDREIVYTFRDWYEHWLRSSVEGFEGKS